MRPVVDDPRERFPLVDTDGREIGSAPRERCHRDPTLVHPSIHVVVVTALGPLWQLRGPYKDTAPGLWDHACSGHVGLGEEPAGAALRELAEEVGIEAQAADLEELGRLLAPLETETELTTVYRLRHEGPFTFGLPELAGLVALPRETRPSPLSPSCVLISARLDADMPGWDA